MRVRRLCCEGEMGLEVGNTQLEREREFTFHVVVIGVVVVGSRWWYVYL